MKDYNVLVPSRRENKAAQLIGGIKAMAKTGGNSVKPALPYVNGVRGVLPSLDSDVWDDMTDTKQAGYIADAIIGTFETGLNSEYRTANKGFVDAALSILGQCGGRPSVKRAKRVRFNVEIDSTETVETDETDNETDNG